MAGWTEVLLVAFGAQLAVLPGEKVQFIIAGLATRYDPRVVVAAAGSAFAGWTAVEILLGNALRGALPPAVLDAFTATLFAVFGVLLFRSAPEPGRSLAETDGGDFVPGGDVDLPAFLDVPAVRRVAGSLGGSLGGFVPIFLMMAAGEFGDKTQLVTIGLAVQYGAHPAIWAGEMLAILPVSLANAFFFHRFAHRFDLRKAHFAAAGIFLFFAADIALNLAVGFSVWETAVAAAADALAGLV